MLEKNPNHLRAQVARAWMDYIVGTKVPWGTRWVMGGGSRDRGLRDMREAATETGDFYSEVEADFALWEMLMRDGKRDQAVPVARELLARFPENEELAKFISRLLAAWSPEPGAGALQLLVVSNRQIHGHGRQRETHAGADDERQAACSAASTHPPRSVGYARRCGGRPLQPFAPRSSAQATSRPATASAIPATAAPATP